MFQFFNIKTICIFSIFVSSVVMYAPKRGSKELRHENVINEKKLEFFKPGRPSQFSRDVTHLLGSSMGWNSHDVDVIAACLLGIIDSEQRYEYAVERWRADDKIVRGH